MTKSSLTLHSITKLFGRSTSSITLFNHIDYEFVQGESYALTGTSGVGKSTLVHILAGLDAPTTGYVTYDGKDLYSFNHDEKSLFFNQKIGLIFQVPYLINELTVLENIMLKGIVGKIPPLECKNIAYKLLEQLNLIDKAESYPQVLSGGQQQRAAMARALLSKPSFLLADEPTGNLDEKNSIELIELLLHYQKEYGMGLIISTHDPQVMQKMNIQLHLKDGILLQA